MEKDNRNSSEDILTRFSLLTDDVNVNSIKGWPYINLGEFFQKDYPEMFSALKLGINIKKCNISINLSRVPRPYFNMGVGECVLTDTLTFPLIPNILFYCVQTVFTNR